MEKRLEKKGTLPFCVRIATNGEPCLSVRQLDGTFVHSKFSVNVKSGACSIVQKGSTVNATSLRGMLEALGYVEAPPPPQENLYVDFAPVAERVVSTYVEAPAAELLVAAKMKANASRASPTTVQQTTGSSSSSSGSGRRRRHRSNRSRTGNAANEQDDESGSGDADDDNALPDGYVMVPQNNMIAAPGVKSSGSGVKPKR